MPTWTVEEDRVLREMIMADKNIQEIASVITTHSPIAIRARVDRLNLQIAKSLGIQKVSIKDLQEYANKINEAQGLFLAYERGSVGIMVHEDGLSVIQYVDNNLDYCVHGSHLTPIGCYKVLQDIERTCVNR